VEVRVGVDPGDVLLRPLVRVTGRWTFWADAIVGAAPLGPVDVAKAAFTTKLNDFGTGSATILLPSGLDVARLQQLWSWRLWCFYDDGVTRPQPVWCGAPTGIVDTGTASVDMTFTELTGYLAKRTSDWSPSKIYSQVEQMTIASDLAAAVTDVGVTLAVGAASGVLRDRTYEYLASNRGQLLTELAGVIQGPQFRTEYDFASAGQPRCTLRVGYPRVGSNAAQLGTTMPGGAMGYQATWDSDQMRTRTFAVGDLPDNAASNAAKPVKVVDAPQANMPRLDAVDDWQGVVVQSTLNEKAATASQQQAAPALQLSVTPGLAEPTISTYDVGDDVTVNLATPLTGNLQISGQLIQCDVDTAAGTAAWTVAVSLPPPRVRYHLARRLDRLDAAVATMFRSGPLTNI
jgi:hypothetical protein